MLKGIVVAILYDANTASSLTNIPINCVSNK